MNEGGYVATERSQARNQALRPVGLLALAGLVGLALTTLLSAPAAASKPSLLAQDEQDDSEDDTQDEEDPGPGLLFGTLRSEDETIGGVELVIRDADGDEVDRVVSDDDGSWEVEVPGGDYTVVVESLPEGVELRDEDQESTDISVDDGDRAAVPIQLGPPPETRGILASIAQQLLSGLRFGLIIAMAAIGLSLVFGTTGLINFAHGDTVMFGAFAAYLFNATIGLPLLVIYFTADIGSIA
ncbi:MAG: ABC transporter permease subunit, partial [Nitriliruptoraceae bacterium]